MDWNSGYGKLIAIGLVFFVSSVAWWVWNLYEDNATSEPKGMFTGAVLILVVGITWMIRDRKQAP